jgi:hypothetical protein
MISFIIAFRHPESTNNYSQVVQLLEDTLYSLINQTDQNFSVYIGCNIAPELDIVDTRIQFCPIDCPLPSNRKEILMDKGVKRAIAIQTAIKNVSPDLFFLLDADDLVSKYCVAELHSLETTKSAGGYWLERGYLLDMFNRRVQEKCGFNRYCGSSLVLNSQVVTDVLFLHKDNLQSMRSYSDFISGCSAYVLEHILGNHIVVKSYMASLKFPLEKIINPMVCWKVNTGENESRTKIPSGSRKIDSEFLTSFSISQEYGRVTNIWEELLERYRFVNSWFASKQVRYK